MIDKRRSGGASGGSGPSRGEGQEGVATQLGRYAGFGLTIGLSTALFAWLGTLLDERLGTEPAFVHVGAFLGFAAGFYSMYWRLVLHDGSTDDRSGRD